MKDGWQMKRLGEVCEVIAGQSPESKFYNEDEKGLPFYQGKKEYGEKFIGEPTTWTTKITKEAEKDDILMSVRAPVGPINFSTQKICIGRGLAAIRAGKLIHKDFLYNFLLKHESEITGNSGAVFDSINKSQIEEIQISIPPLAEQQRIVSVLDEAFAAIDQAKENTQRNLQNAKALFQSELNFIFTNKGAGWVEKKLGEVCEYDKTPNKSDNLPYVGLEDIQSNTGKLIGTLTPRSVKSLTFQFNNEHVLYGRLRPYLNKVLLPDFEGHCSTEIFPIKPNKNVLNRNFLFHWLISLETMYKINATWTGATLPRANMNLVLEFELYVPPLQQQTQIVQQLDKLSGETKKLEAQYAQKLNSLEALKKSILEKAFSGELKTTAIAVERERSIR